MNILKKESFTKAKKILFEKKNIVFINYAIFAGIATIIDFSILYLLTESGMYYLWSATISYIVGMITNFSLNKRYAFKNKSKKIIKQFSKFSVIAIAGLLINELILLVLVSKFKVMYLIAKIISVILVGVLSFFGHKRITFREEK